MRVNRRRSLVRDLTGLRSREDYGQVEVSRRASALFGADWITLTLLGSTTAIAGDEPQIVKDPLGFAYMRGRVTNASAGTSANILLLPEGYWPEALEVYPYLTYVGFKVVYLAISVYPNGVVRAEAAESINGYSELPLANQRWKAAPTT